MPPILVAMRLADMHKRHPKQDDSRVCARCQHPLGIYPSGQAALAGNPGMAVICQICAVAEPSDINFPAAKNLRELKQEITDSYDVKRH